MRVFAAELKKLLILFKADPKSLVAGIIAPTTPIISKKPVKPGKSRDRGTEFTTKLLLLD